MNQLFPLQWEYTIIWEVSIFDRFLLKTSLFSLIHVSIFPLQILIQFLFILSELGEIIISSTEVKVMELFLLYLPVPLCVYFYVCLNMYIMFP